MLLTENDIRKIVRLVCESVLDKMNVREKGITRNDIMNGVTLYHRPKDATVFVGGKKMSVIDSLFKYGFSREFTGSNGGNMYGAGVYSVYNLKSSNEKASWYGSSIIKLKLIGGYKNFLIFSKQLAKETYGERWHITQQIRDLFPKDIAERIIRNVHLVMHDDRDSFNNIAKSSIPAVEIIRMLGERGMNNSSVRGLVYNGGHDGACCFIRDFSSVIPVAVSKDNGRTWEYRLNDGLINRINNEVDTHYQFGNDSKYKDIADKSVNGFVMVWDDKDRVNYIPANSNKPISDVWFDNGANWEKTEDGVLYASVEYEGNYLDVVKDGNTYEVYNDNGEYICLLDELKTFGG